MGKDPAVLFYTSDFLTGTFTFTDEQVGKYIRLLCLQHQKGILTEKDMLNICQTYDKDVYAKFVKKDGFYYNERMSEETERRKSYSESRRKNRVTKKDMSNICKTYDKHMETETETETETINESSKKEYFLGIFNQFLPPELQSDWCAYLDYCYERGDIKLNRPTITEQAKFLREHQKDAKKIMRESIRNNWKGLFEVKGGRISDSGNKPRPEATMSDDLKMIRAKMEEKNA